MYYFKKIGALLTSPLHRFRDHEKALLAEREKNEPHSLRRTVNEIASNVPFKIEVDAWEREFLSNMYNGAVSSQSVIARVMPLWSRTYMKDFTSGKGTSPAVLPLGSLSEHTEPIDRVYSLLQWNYNPLIFKDTLAQDADRTGGIPVFFHLSGRRWIDEIDSLRPDQEEKDSLKRSLFVLQKYPYPSDLRVLEAIRSERALLEHSSVKGIVYRGSSIDGGNSAMLMASIPGVPVRQDSEKVIASYETLVHNMAAQAIEHSMGSEVVEEYMARGFTDAISQLGYYAWQGDPHRNESILTQIV